MDGLLVVDKPSGPTSHDVVARVRRALGEPRVGHTGTLDPLATGVLPLVLGRATRLARFLSTSDKSYEAVVRLGVATDTYDAEGVPLGPPHEGPLPSRDAIDAALDAFRGTFVQHPPMFSAKKIGGRRSYKIARSARGPGKTPPLPEPVEVQVRRLEVISVDADLLKLEIECSSGFYVRSLAHDLGGRLGIGAHLLSLRRTRIGDLTLDGAMELAALEHDRARVEQAVVPLAGMLGSLLAVRLTDEGARRAAHGREIRPEDRLEEPAAPGGSTEWLRLVDPAGQLIAVATRSDTAGLLHPSIVLV
jgi:tRNA pseudouridine55 synthase